MKAVIHQALRDVLGGDAVERAQVEDAFVRDEAVAAVERGEMFFEPLGNVIRVESGELLKVPPKEWTGAEVIYVV